MKQIHLRQLWQANNRLTTTRAQMDPRRQQQQGAQRMPRSLAHRYVDALAERTSQIEMSERQSATPLRSVLTLDVPPRFSQAESPSCSLILHVPTDDNTVSIAKLLRALAAVLRHSQLLNNFPSKKASFWKAILSSKMDFEARFKTVMRSWMLEDERFPSRVVLKVINHAENPKEALLKQTSAFFTAKPDWRFRDLLKTFLIETEGVHRCNQISIGLTLTDVKLSAGSVKMLQHVVLDQVCGVRGDRLFCLDKLDLSNNHLGAEALQVIAEIIRSNDVYKLKHVTLTNVTRREENHSSDVSSALTAIIQASFGHSVEAQCGVRQNSSGSLSYLLLDNNYLRVEHYATLFSALRYDETLRELGLSGTMSSDMDVDDRAQCWRWIGFGFFYRRLSKTPYARVNSRKIDLSMSSFTTADADAFEASLHDPSELLKYNGNSSSIPRANYSERSLSSTSLTQCDIKVGAVIRSDPDLASEPLSTVKEATQLESLWMDDDWRCVVLPGFGLGWIEASQVQQVDEREFSASMYDTLPKTEVVMSSISWPNSVPLCSFIRSTGPQLVMLELQHNSRMENVVPTILSSCPSLQQLSLEGWITSFSDSSAYESDVLELFQALSGDFGRQLLSLDLTGNRLGDSVIAILAGSLSAPHQVPALQHLRLCRSWMGERGLQSLCGALEVNKNLSCVELDIPVDSADPHLPQPMELEAVRLDEDLEGELLRANPLPLAAKLALLSVLARFSGGSSARTSVDTWVVGSIFDFARRRVCRRIIWR